MERRANICIHLRASIFYLYGQAKDTYKNRSNNIILAQYEFSRVLKYVNDKMANNDWITVLVSGIGACLRHDKSPSLSSYANSNDA